jgi:hypothetical protein
MRETRNANRILVGDPEGKGSLCTPGINGKTILKLDRRSYTVRVWLGQYPIERSVCTVKKQQVPEEARIFLIN